MKPKLTKTLAVILCLLVLGAILAVEECQRDHAAYCTEHPLGPGCGMEGR